MNAPNPSRRIVLMTLIRPDYQKGKGRPMASAALRHGQVQTNELPGSAGGFDANLDGRIASNRVGADNLHIVGRIGGADGGPAVKIGRGLEVDGHAGDLRVFAEGERDVL